MFIFFMITDPKTTVHGKRWQMLVAFTVAAVEMLLRLHSSIYAPLYSLFLVGPCALLLEMFLSGRTTNPISSPPYALVDTAPR